MLRGLQKIGREEWSVCFLAFLKLFLILCGYYMIRPIRESYGTEIGPKYFQWLFTATFVSMLAINPIFAAVAGRWPRQRFVPTIHLLFALMLVAFSMLIRASSNPTPTWLASLFFVWVSVFNYIAVSLFWSVMTDLMTIEQGKRLFGVISAGGTLGALCGPIITDRLIKSLGSARILELSSVAFVLVAGCTWLLTRMSSSNSPTTSTSNESFNRPLESSLGGSPWAGMGQTFASPYLLGIGVYMLLGSALGSLIYIQQQQIVSIQIPASDRTQFFARIDFAVNVLALVLELAIAGPLFSAIGLRIPLLALPLLGLVGIPLLSGSPTVALVCIVMVLRRSVEYAIAKPAREVLFTVVTREQKYKSKNFIDTVLARGGDTLGAWTPTILLSAFGAGKDDIGPIVFASIPISILFGMVGWRLVTEQSRRQLLLPASLGDGKSSSAVS